MEELKVQFERNNQVSLVDGALRRVVTSVVQSHVGYRLTYFVSLMGLSKVFRRAAAPFLTVWDTTLSDMAYSVSTDLTIEGCSVASILPVDATVSKMEVVGVFPKVEWDLLGDCFSVDFNLHPFASHDNIPYESSYSHGASCDGLYGIMGITHLLRAIL